MATVAGDVGRCIKCGGWPIWGTDPHFGRHVGCVNCGTLKYLDADLTPKRDGSGRGTESNDWQVEDTVGKQVRRICMALSVISRATFGRQSIMAWVGSPPFHYIKAEAVLRLPLHGKPVRIERVEWVDIWGLPETSSLRDRTLVASLVRDELIRALDNNVERFDGSKLYLNQPET